MALVSHGTIKEPNKKKLVHRAQVQVGLGKGLTLEVRYRD